MTNFTDNDLFQIQQHGLTIDGIISQLHDFEHGFLPVDLVAPAAVGNGIFQPSPDQRTNYIRIYDDYLGTHRVMKFVPASGAATRMFKDFFDFVKTGISNASVDAALSDLNKFAFYDELQKHIPHSAPATDVISAVVDVPGLNYGHLPKALILFHKYPTHNRTALEEHLVEGAQYESSNHNVRIHFTVSPEHRTGFDQLLQNILPKYEQDLNVRYDISMSEQKSSTDTIAVNPDNTVFRNKDGSLLFRPAGHGALIENLNDIDADIVFIKNIDNVMSQSNRDETITYKKILAGMLISLQNKIFDYLRIFDDSTAVDLTLLDKVAEFIKTELMIKLPDHISTQTTSERAAYYYKLLNRPIRVCGMVRNAGEPGGGPFWVRGSDGITSLQILESAQIALDDISIMKESTHFNPVDLVCGLKDHRGKRYHLPDYVDPSTGFIAEKSKDGAVLRALERPGLWNGAMANWTTVFVDVPMSTFTPVKVINDLLRPVHQDTGLNY